MDSYITNLNSAIADGNVVLTTNLLERGLKEFPELISKEPLLFTAIDHGQSEIIEVILQFGVTQVLSFENKNVVYYASEQGRVECLRYLLDHGLFNFRPHYDPNPLEIACKGTCPTGDYEGTVRLLATQLPELINISNGDGDTPLSIALINKRIKLAQILLEYDVNVDFINQQDDHIFQYAVTCGDTQIINTMLERLPFPAHISAQCGNLDYFKQHECLDLVDDLGDTVLHSAVYGEQNQVVDWFIARWKNINVKNEEGYTPLHYASELYYSNILESLLKAGADPNIRDHQGQTPLHRLGHTVKNLQLLLAYGADPLVKDNEGYTPKTWLGSMEYHCTEIVKLLEEAEKSKE